ncbi:MAG: DUF6519 domain-containing protein [Ferruginibacter sp.]
MPNFDISRVATNHLKHLTGLRMQQGRVLTDDDWNENERIEEEIVRRTNVDIIGRAGTPDRGFRIENLSTAGGLIDFDIHKGTMYLGGLRLEMDETETFRLQKDWLQKDDNNYKPPVLNPGEESYDLVFLETWQQPVSAIEDSSLFEPALGGPDTTICIRNMQRVNIFRDAGSDECPIAWKKLRSDWSTAHFGKINKEDELIPDTSLKISFTDSGDTDDLCTPAVTGGYLGAENQALRVQVTHFDHVANTGHYTWGFDNAAPFYRVTVSADGTTCTMITEPKDQYHWPLAGQVVELIPWSAVLPNNEKIAEHNGFFSKVAISYNPDSNQFELNTALPAGFGAQWLNRADAAALRERSAFFYMRVWNRGTDVISPAEIPITAAIPSRLGNTGLQVTFTGNDFTNAAGIGNFWVIAARPSTPKSVMPWELITTGISPHGTRFFYTPLAIIHWTNIAQQVQGKIIHDCRRHFHPLTEDDCCCTFTVGDGVSSKGDYQSIQEAVDSLPAEGGKICVLKGIHEASVIINNRKKIHITGCGEQTIVRTPVNNLAPIFVIKNSRRITLDHLTLVAFEGIAVAVEDDIQFKSMSEEITIRENRILALVHAVRVNLRGDIQGNNSIKITYNQIGMYDKPKGDVAIFSLADDVLIERNRIVMIPPPDDGPDRDPPPPDPNFDPCADLKKLYAQNKKFREMVDVALHFVTAYMPGGKITMFKTPGGIQIGCGSERVWILENEVIGGRGNGITLGHNIIQPDIDSHEVIPFSPSLYDITIQQNFIYEMGHSGIGTVLYLMPNEKKIIIHIENLLIGENIIKYCVQELITKKHELVPGYELPVSAISLAFCEDCIIRENWLEDNGRNQLHAVSGIYIFYAEKVDISNNRVINNGPHTQETAAANKNVRGGIVVWYATKLPALKKPDTPVLIAVAPIVNIPVFDAIPAVKVHDNIVSQPLGHALFVIAYGPVSVVSNQFTSEGINKREYYSMKAGAVFILDLGFSKDRLNIALLPIRQWRYVNPSIVIAAAGAANTRYRFYFLYQYLPAGRVMYSANQVTLDMRSFEIDICFSSEMIISLDDIAFLNNQSECAGAVTLIPRNPYPSDIVLFNTALMSVSTRCSDNRFTDGFTYTIYSLLSIAFLNTAIGNQSTHCLVVPYWIFRRKALNIELNILDCMDLRVETALNAVNAHSGDPRFNLVAN